MHEIRELAQKEFPPLLHEINDPPKTLFLKGTLPDPEKYTYLAVIGSRKFTSYGRECCERLIEGLSKYPVVIVSGLALGIDAVAHRAAVKSGIPTVAVPGSGLGTKVLYPSAHHQLAEDILSSGGGLLSELSEHERAMIWTFPQRNRIMAGMSKATLVIEAGEKSGTLITARLALDYNRDVLVVPGPIFSPNSKGTNKLMRQGATPVSTSEEIADELGLTSDTKALPLLNLTPLETHILEILEEPTPRDLLIEELGLSVSEANAALIAMEIKGLITEIGGEMQALR